MDIEPQTELLAVAARWYARLSAPECSADDRACFAQWFASDPRHAEVFYQVKRAAEATTRAAQSDPRLLALADAALAEEAVAIRQPARRPARWAWGLAASVLVGLGVLRWTPDPAHVPLETSSYTTTLETRVVSLSDGSQVQLDAGTTVEVEMYAARRVIRLEQGRAYFKVAHDANRPFTVSADGVRTVALGTEFEVEHATAGVSVTLLQGSVLVSDVARESPRWEEKLAPGEQVLVAGGEKPQRRLVDLERAASWTRGRHVFEHTPLAEAVAEINRYSERKLRLGDRSLEHLEIGGSFVMGEVGDIAQAIAAALPVEVVEAGPRELILFSRHEPSLH